MERRHSVNNPNKFCYICGSYVVVKQRQTITSFVKNVYHAYFGVKIGDQDESWTPHTVCSVCVEALRNWQKGRKKCLSFGVPMVWREPRNHTEDCYFCSFNVQGFNSKNKKQIVYPNLDSAIRPVPHGPDVPIPTAPKALGNIISSESEESNSYPDDSDFTPDFREREVFNQSELNDLVRDLHLPKDASELLASRLREKHVLAPGVTSSYYRNREKELCQYFTQEGSLVYCNNIPDLVSELGNLRYVKEEWRLFIDSSKRSLKGVLLHNGNELASVPVAHSVHLKETYENLELLLKKINYQEHQWMLCGDLKVLCMLLGQQGGYTKFPCFICEWDSRARDRHWTQKEWPSRASLTPGSKNVLRDSLVDAKKVLLPPLHIKLGLMKQFVQALDKNGQCFKYLCEKFPALSDAKLKNGIFVGPQIRTLCKEKDFQNTMTNVEKNAWVSFKEVIDKFLGNYKDENYENIVQNMLQHFRRLGCNMSLKVHFLFSHLNYFPENLGAVSEEQGERFHQDIKEMERRYQGRWSITMMADYCWMLKRRMSGQRSFLAKRRIFHSKKTE